jgi:hypothetical protein
MATNDRPEANVFRPAAAGGGPEKDYGNTDRSRLAVNLVHHPASGLSI